MSTRSAIRLCILATLAAPLGCGGDDSGASEDGGADVELEADGGADGDAAPETGDDVAPEVDEEADVPAEDGAGDGSSTCPRAGDPGPGDHTLALDYGGLSRSYIVHVPPGYDPSAPTPVVFNFHGFTSNASQEVFFSNMNPTADAHGFLVVYPDGYASSWNAGSCCGDAASEGVDDVGFIRALVDEVASLLCIDRDRVYASGMSNGGFLSYRLACEAADVFAGFAPVAGGIGITGCSPSRPVSLIAYHGTADSYVPYAFGESSLHDYADLAGCTGDPVRTMYGTSYCDVYEACDGGVRVGLCTLDGMDHCWPGGEPPRTICETFIGVYSVDLNANEHLWEFLDG